MNGTRSHRVSRPGSGPTGATAGAPAGPPSYWGWSHQNQRMEMMDLPSYLDSFRQGYDTALQDLSSRVQTLTGALGAMTAPAGAPTPYATASAAPHAWQGSPHHQHHGRHHHDHDCGCEERHREHEHDHDCDCGCGHREHECGCGCERDCRCECCIVDADIVVYAHCGEVRVVPIEIENETRKVREDVTVDLSEVRSSGGHTLPWQAMVTPHGPLTLEPCSTTKLELLVHVACGEAPQAPQAPAGKASPRAAAASPRAAAAAEAAGLLAAVAERRATARDVDDCEVGYVTIRLGGCLVRPIVVAIAALPLACGSYRAGCSCSCCC